MGEERVQGWLNVSDEADEQAVELRGLAKELLELSFVGRVEIEEGLKGCWAMAALAGAT